MVLLVITLANGAITLLKPIARLHSRLDVLEAELRAIAAAVQRLEQG